MDEDETTVKPDYYGCLTFKTPDISNINSNCRSKSLYYPYESVSLSGRIRRRSKPTYIMKDLFFHCQCQKNEDKTRKLNLNGHDLENKIGRRFKDWDVPYLLIFLRKNKNVTHLNLAYNELSTPGLIGLIDHIIGPANHILELDLRYNEIIDKHGIKYMLSNAEKFNVQTLRLSGNKFGIKSAKKIALMLENNPFIQHIEVADVDHNEASLIYFMTILRADYKRYNKTLKVLDISRPIPKWHYYKLNSFDAASSIGTMLQYNTSLEELHLQKFNFYCHDIEEMFLNGARDNKALIILDLCCNNIGDHGVEIIADWLEKRSTPLRSLLLGHNIISNHGMSTLSRSIPFSKLKMLDVSHNRFDDEGGVEFFNSIKKPFLMEHIRIWGNKTGHLTAKIVERMLCTGVFLQENIDVRPYKVDGMFQFAYYKPTRVLYQIITKECI